MPANFNKLFRISLMQPNLGKLGVRNFFSSGAPYKVNLSVKTNIAKPLVDKHFPAISIAQLPAALVGSFSNTAKLLYDLAKAAPSLPSEGTFFDPYSDVDGHLSTPVTKVEHGDNSSARVHDPAFPLKAAFSAFPNGIRLIPQSMAESFIAAPDKRVFLEQNQSALSEFTDKTFNEAKAPGWSYEGHYIILGNGSLVRCVQHRMVTNEEGVSLHVWHMQTSSRHIFDGSFVWAWHFDPKHPTMITCLGLQVGKHPWFDLDRLNVWGGAGLFDYMNRAAPYFMAAREKGLQVILGDRSVITDPYVRISGALLASGDRLSPFGQYLRDNGPPNTRAEIVVLGEEALENAREQGPEILERLQSPTAENTGIEIDGLPVILQEAVFGDSLGPAGEEKVLARFSKLKEYTMSQENWKLVRSDVLDYAHEKLGSSYSSESGSELIEKLFADPASRLAVEKIITDRLMQPIVPQLQAEIDVVTSDPVDQAYFAERAQTIFREDVTLPLLTREGALRSAIELHILNEQIKVLDKDAVSERLAEAVARKVQEEHEIERLKSQHPEDEAEREEIEKALQEHEAADREASVDQERYHEQVRDLSNADDRKAERQKSEKDHVDAMFPR